jgi:hypothetical protein
MNLRLAMLGLGLGLTCGAALTVLDRLYRAPMIEVSTATARL